MENKVTFTKSEITILIGGIAAAWDSINENPEGFDPELDKKVEKVFENIFNEDGTVKDKEIDEELGKDETFANLAHKILDFYNGGNE